MNSKDDFPWKENKLLKEAYNQNKFQLMASNAILPTGEKIRLLRHKISKKLRKIFCALRRRGTHHKGTHL